MIHYNAKGIIAVLGIDLAKQSFQLRGMDKSGQTVLTKKLSRNKLSAFMAHLLCCLIGIEAGSGANYWHRVFQKIGHTVRMIDTGTKL